MSKRALELNLAETDIQELRLMQRQPNLKPRVLTRCNALLFLNEGKSPKEVANLLGFRNLETLLDLKKRYNKGGLSKALYDAPRPGRPIEILPEERAKITALACTNPPEGRSRWTLRLLADKAVELELVDDISYRSISNILKKTN